MKIRRGRTPGIIKITVITVVLLAGSTCAAPVEEWNRTCKDIRATIGDVQQTSDDGSKACD